MTWLWIEKEDDIAVIEFDPLARKLFDHGK